MGLDNREYIREEQRRYGGGLQGGMGFGGGGQSSMVIKLIIINVVILFLDLFFPIVEGQGEKVHLLNHWMAIKTDSLWQIWTFISYGFAHSGIDSKTSIWHIAGNMLALFFLGRAVEQRLGGQEFLKFYLFGILVGGIAFVVSQLIQGQTGACVGASAAVSAVVILFCFMYPNVTVLLFFVIPMRAWILGVLFVGMDLMRAFDPETRVAWESHLAGAAFGAAYFYFRWNFNWLRIDWLAGMFSRKPSLRVHDPDSKFNKLKRDADRILAKINAEGEESLNRGERKILNRYSQELRKRRVDS